MLDSVAMPAPALPRHEAARRRRRSAGRLRRRHEALLGELRLAERVQRSMLPRALPEVPGVAFGAAMRPCLHLAGDFYNAFRLDRNRVGLYLGDVMGHGPAAALLAVFAMQALRTHTKRIAGDDYHVVAPAEAVAALNRELIAADFPGGPFVTLVYGVLDVPARTWTYCSAGHPPAWLLRRGEAPSTLSEGGPLLGIIDVPYTQHQMRLGPGDRLVLYSDGADAVRWGDSGRGADGLAACLASLEGRPPQDLADAAFSLTGPRRPADDVALLIAEIDPAGAEPARAPGGPDARRPGRRPAPEAARGSA